MIKKPKPAKKEPVEPFYTDLAEHPVLVSAQEFARNVMAEAMRRCDTQIARAKAGERRKATIYLDMMLTQIRTTIWDDPPLRRNLEILVRRTMQELSAIPPAAAAPVPPESSPARDAPPAPPSMKRATVITVCKDCRTIRKGKDLLVHLTTDEGNWISACVQQFIADGTDEYDLRDVSMSVFGKNTKRIEPSRIFRRSGVSIFHALFEKTEIPGVYGKRENVVFDADDGTKANA